MQIIRERIPSSPQIWVFNNLEIFYIKHNKKWHPRPLEHNGDITNWPVRIVKLIIDSGDPFDDFRNIVSVPTLEKWKKFVKSICEKKVC